MNYIFVVGLPRPVHGMHPHAIAAAILALALSGHAVHAQTTPPAFAEPVEPALQALEPIVVRARLVDEVARELPFSISVVTGQEIEERRLLTLEDVIRQVPGVDINTPGNSWSTNIRIRGVGALQKVNGEDASVALRVDGMPMSMGNVSSAAFDLERVEVLKGPQGTLFGSNSEAGAINVITRQPTRTLEGYARAEVGQDRQRLLEGALGGPLGETLSARVAMRGNASDHWVDNYRTGAPVSKPRDLSLRGTLLWEPLAGTSMNLSAQRDDLRNHPNLTLLAPYGNQPVTDRSDLDDKDKRTVNRVTATLEHDLDKARLTSVTGYSHAKTWMANVPYEGLVFRQLLGMAPDGGHYVFDNNEKSFSQELRLTSRADSPIFWVSGMSYYNNDRHMDMPLGAFDNFNPASTLNGDTLRRLKSRGTALFGEVTVPLNTRLKATAGLRHTWERKSYNASYQAAAGNPNPVRYAEDHDSLRDSYTTGRVALNWAATVQTNIYAVASRGYKSGGYNETGSNITNGGKDLPYTAARVQSYEVGAKHEAASGRWGVDIALYYNKVRDDHLLAFDPVTFTRFAENVDTRSKGLELSGFGKLGAGFEISGALVLMDAKIRHVPTGSTSGAANGNRVPDVPKWSASVNLTHRLPLQAFLGMDEPVLNSMLTARTSGNRAADPGNTLLLSRYYQLDMRVGVASGNAEVYLWGNNLTNQQYDLYGYYYPAMMAGGSGAVMGLPARGRTLGAGASYYF